MRRRWWLVALAALIGIPNGLAWNHARAMTTFSAVGTRTAPPEELGWSAAIRTLLFGVTIPRPVDRSRPEASLRPEDHVVTGDLGPLEVLSLGDGDAVVVLIHGYAGERTALLPTARLLVAAGYRVVAPNLRGTGGSAGSGTTLGWSEADDVAAVVRWVGDTYGDDAPVLYGFSMGGAAAIGAVGRLGVPSRAVVAEATFDRLSTTVGHRFGSMGLPARPLTDLLLFWGGVQLGIDPGRVAPVDDAARVAVPALVIGGTVDLRVHPAETRALAAAFPRGELALIEGLPHGQLATSSPEEWDRVVGAFLRRVAPAATSVGSSRSSSIHRSFSE